MRTKSDIGVPLKDKWFDESILLAERVPKPQMTGILPDYFFACTHVEADVLDAHLRNNGWCNLDR